MSSSPRFLQLHTLTSYPAALLNRDDAGFAKRIPFGGVTRTRISSQCLKRHWRTFEGENSFKSLDAPETIRSRHTFEQMLVQPLVEKDGISTEVARAVTASLMGWVLGKSEKSKKKDEQAAEEKKASKKASSKSEEKKKDEEGLMTGQIVVLGRPEVDYLLKLARQVCAQKPSAEKAADLVEEMLGKEGKDNLKALKRAAGLGAAMFGRMVTSDVLARGDAAVHVAHSFTVHGEAAESDYFSAVDDLLNDSGEGKGSGHIGNVELTSGLFYSYVVVDLPLLVSNLEGCERADWLKQDRGLAAEVAERMVHLMATVSPGAKLGSTAPYSYASLIFAEMGNSQPRTLANAFLQPIPTQGDMLKASFVALASHVRELDAMYGASTQRRLAGLREDQLPGLRDTLKVPEATNLPELAKWVSQQVAAR
jgi:CRISPR system Cascade subunit CasC